MILSRTISVSFLFLVIIILLLLKIFLGGEFDSDFILKKQDNRKHQDKELPILLSDFEPIPGNQNDPINGRIKHFDLPPVVNLSKFSPDPDIGIRMSRVRLSIIFKDETNVGQVNDLLRKVNGRIVGVLDLANTFFIQIPDSPDLTLIRQTIKVIEQSNIAESVSPDTLIGGASPR